MLMSIISHLLCAWFAFLMPCFSTFKALSRRPLSEPDLEKWSMYWVVIGAFVAFEYVAEWLIYWLPFYWEIKTIFMLYLALPQTQGSTFIYQNYLQPFFIQNEGDLDAGIVAFQRNTFTFLKARLDILWDLLSQMLKKIPASKPATAETGQPPAGGIFPWESAMGLWKQYGPSITSALQPLSRSVPTSQPSAPATASTTSTQLNGASSTQYRTPFVSDATGHAGPSIPFPEPEHH